MIGLPDKTNFAVTNQRCLNCVDAHREALFINSLKIRPPQAHLALGAQLIEAHSDFLKIILNI